MSLILYYLKLHDSPFANLLSEGFSYVSSEKRDYVSKLKFEKDKARTISGELMVRFGIIEKLGIHNEDISFYKNKFNKPYLRNDPNFYFNISHSGDYILCGISQEELGVDIEENKKFNFEICEEFFHDKEISQIKEKAYKNRLNTFYKIWSSKESYFKYLGTGLQNDLSSYYVKLQGKDCTVNNTSHLELAHITLLDLDPFYSTAICTKEKSKIELQKLNLNEILNKIRMN